MHVAAFVTDRTPVNRSIYVPKPQNVKYTLEQAMMMMMTYIQYLAEA